MSDLIQFQSFAKGKKSLKAKTGNCVIYTRVSTKEQADNNLSLETQKKACEQYAVKSGFQILGYFGGTYESAKTDERKEFNNMLAFVKRSKQNISHIIVYSVDRFSRSGGNAIYIAEQLKKEGIVLYAVSQPTDTTTASGSLQQNIQFIFSEYDNQLRREKCMAGTKEMLLRGEWCTAPPMGYDIIHRDGKRQIVLNNKGKLIRKAFHLKAKENLSSEEIRKRLAPQGLKISSQSLSAVFRNPFYCGLLVHNLLEGQIVEGKHEKMVSKELFMAVNGILAERAHGYTHKKENDDVPLKRFLRCEECGEYLRAYKAYKNQKYYYKCNTKGCNCNKRADSLHETFKDMLSDFVLDIYDEDVMHIVKQQLIATYNQLNETKEEDRSNIKKQLAESNSKLERLEERFVLEEISKEMWDKFRTKFVKEREELDNQLTIIGNKVSNLEECIDYAFEFSMKLATEWDLSDYTRKQQLQFLIFPEGILYNRKNNQCRTPKTNELFAYIAGLSSVLKEYESGKITKEMILPALVASPRIELGSKV